MMGRDSIIAKRHRKAGFTLVELMLAMAFVALLMLAITYCIIQVSTTYGRGLTLRQVNDAGRAVSDDIKRAIIRSPGSAELTVIRTGPVSNPTGGRLCTGEYTYIWNTPRGLDNPDAPGNNNRYADGVANASPIRLVRVLDRNAALCETPIQPLASAEGAVDLLAGAANAGTTDRPLALHSLQIHRIPGPAGPSAAATEHGLVAWRVNFTLGTSETAAINAGSCRPPRDAQSNQTYCAINNFSFTTTKSLR